nr:IS66 family transposase [Janthinobacterium sp. NKUCC06_STL]
MHADAYAGFNALKKGGAIEEAACWAHPRRKFYDLHTVRRAPPAIGALRRTAELHVIEAEIRGKTARRTQGCWAEMLSTAARQSRVVVGHRV